MKKKWLIVLLVITAMLFTVSLTVGCGGGDKKEDSEGVTETTKGEDSGTTSQTQDSSQLGPDGTPVKTLEDFPNGQDGADVEAVVRTDKGDIVLQFFPDSAPVSVAAFIQRAREGGYNGTTFHRVEPGFVIQGGDPKSVDPNDTTVGSGGPGYYLPAEFSDRPHLEGSLAMARSSHPNSGGCQFYICLAPQPMLDGEYTVFGQTVSGMEVVQQIAKGDVIREVIIRPKTQ